MFRRPMNVRAEDVQILPTAKGTRVLFTQYWESGNYADQGRKEIVFDAQNPARIVREEMFTTYRVEHP